MIILVILDDMDFQSLDIRLWYSFVNQYNTEYGIIVRVLITLIYLNTLVALHTFIIRLHT